MQNPIEESLQAKLRALVSLPEIALTPQEAALYIQAGADLLPPEVPADPKGEQPHE